MGNTSVKNADVALCVLSFPEVLVPSTSSSSQHHLDLQIPPSIQPLITPHTLFLLNKSDLVPHILPPTSSTASSFFISHPSIHPNVQSSQVNKAYPTHFQLIPTPTSSIDVQNLETSQLSIHNQAWSTNLVTNQGTREFVQGLVEALKSRYVMHSFFLFVS